MFKVTEAAAAQIKQAANKSGTEGMVLRLAAQRKQDGSIDYLMGFDAATDDDVRVQAGEVEIVIEPKYADLLKGAIMDYVEVEQGEHRFIFMNPNDDHYVPPMKD